MQRTPYLILSRYSFIIVIFNLFAASPSSGACIQPHSRGHTGPPALLDANDLEFIVFTISSHFSSCPPSPFKNVNLLHKNNVVQKPCWPMHRLRGLPHEPVTVSTHCQHCELVPWPSTWVPFYRFEGVHTPVSLEPTLHQVNHVQASFFAIAITRAFLACA